MFNFDYATIFTTILYSLPFIVIAVSVINDYCDIQEAKQNAREDRLKALAEHDRKASEINRRIIEKYGI